MHGHPFPIFPMHGNELTMHNSCIELLLRKVLKKKSEAGNKEAEHVFNTKTSSDKKIEAPKIRSIMRNSFQF